MCHGVDEYILQIKYLLQLFCGTLALLMFNNNTYSGIKENNYFQLVERNNNN